MKRKKRGGKNFWDHEYKGGDHISLSMKVSGDLEKFTRWLQRHQGKEMLNVTSSVLDLGCGNGRNVLWLNQEFGMRGVGYDISIEAIKQARIAGQEQSQNLVFDVLSLTEPIPLPDESQNLALDMMVSHFLNESERLSLIQEIYRVLKPGGFFYYKTFLLDEDTHAKRLITEHGTEETNTYIHPHMRVAEHVSTEVEIEELYGKYFTIHEVKKSHRHKGKHGKRRSISVYMEKA